MRSGLFALAVTLLSLPAAGAVRYETTSDWGSGFCGQIVVVNDTGAAWDTRTVEFDWDRTFSSL